jgi:hypothetical protein
MYGDESADETRERVFAVAGVIGTEDEWALAMKEWLRRTRGLPFHATDLESRNVRNPDPQKHKDDKKLYADLTNILAGSYLVGFAVALDLAAHRAMFPQVDARDWAYYKCLADVIDASTRTARTFNARPEEDEDVSLQFMFDSRLESNGTAGTLYTMLATHPDWVDTGIFAGNIRFESDDPRLEMGDLLARESMKELDRKVTNSPRPARKSWLALEQTKKFHFIERGQEYWMLLRERVEKPESAALMDAYQQWLIRTGKVQRGQPAHNMRNWILFNAWLDNGGATEETGLVSAAP